MSIWFTSDYHISHKNIIYHCNRPFESIHEMNVALTETHNKLVQPKDTVYFLGDLVMDKRVVSSTLDRLNGVFHFIYGNHDSKSKKIIQGHKKVVSAEELTSVSLNGRLIVLCHYPMRTWTKSHFGSINLHGHCHGTLPPFKNQLDIGIDNIYKLLGEYRPIEISEVLELINV